MNPPDTLTSHDNPSAAATEAHTAIVMFHRPMSSYVQVLVALDAQTIKIGRTPIRRVYESARSVEVKRHGEEGYASGRDPSAGRDIDRKQSGEKTQCGTDADVALGDELGQPAGRKTQEHDHHEHAEERSGVAMPTRARQAAEATATV